MGGRLRGQARSGTSRGREHRSYMVKHKAKSKKIRKEGTSLKTSTREDSETEIKVGQLLTVYMLLGKRFHQKIDMTA